ncbi:hypothetical protein KIN20_023973 [Parelaphostrongylus tenuis]|uniref:Uncharacterized protein n=1 Tax=Parelaphostrongylus tenuis TaxID=148309 RepID=A0AAD5MSU8_PARTN|nr:hypothetical protein KIN20_023973 [Parelaphostrongylus tenuis]
MVMFRIITHKTQSNWSKSCSRVTRNYARILLEAVFRCPSSVPSFSGRILLHEGVVEEHVAPHLK